MKTQMRVFLYIVCCLFLFNSSMEGKTQGMNKDEIDWEENNDSRSSYLPIDGYVEDGTVVLYLYEKPEVAKVTIRDDSGSVVYESIVDGTEVVEIEVEGIGVHKIIIEYDSVSYEGIFNIE